MPTLRLPRIAMVLMVGACLVITLAGIRSVSGIIGPAFLALVLTITVHPIRSWLRMLRFPDWLSSIIIVVAVYVLIVLLAVALVISIGQLASILPGYGQQIQSDLTGLSGWLEKRGVGQDQIDAMVEAIDVGKVVSLATNLLSGILGMLSDLFFIAVLVFFLAFDTTNTNKVLDQIQPHRADLVDAMRNFALGTRSYMAVSTVFGLIVAVMDAAVLAAMGVPGWFVWGVLAFVTNYIPNIGFVIGVVPPALIALLHGGPGLMVWVLVIYTVINVVVQSIIQPRIVGDRVGLSATMTFLSLVFWAWALGPLGALLAVPLTLLVRAILVDADPDARWALPLITGKPTEVDAELRSLPEST